MFKKTVLTLAAVVGLSSSLHASAVDLSLFQSDFNTLLTGIARDVAPTLRLGALSADIQGDATIDHFNLSVLGAGFTTSDGLGKVLRPGAANWDFVLPLADLVNDNVKDNNFFENIMVYPSFKSGIGFGINTWDFALTGMYFPQSAIDAAIDAAGSAASSVKKLNPKFSFGNVGLQVRKTLITDSGFAPALSLGAGYHYTFFNLGVTLSSLDSLGVSAPSVGSNQTLDMNGDFGVSSSSHVFTTDLHLSKHLLIFTPYVKLTGAYQNSTFNGKANLVATVTDSADASNNTTQTIVSNPTVNLSDFAFLVTSGMDLNLAVMSFNVNVVGDMSRAFLKVNSWTLKGIDANAFSLNTGFRFSF